MTFIKLFVLIAVSSLFVIACGGTTPVVTPSKPSPAASPTATASPTPDTMAATAEYYSDNCASCHQDNGEGGIVKIEGKRLKVPSLTKGHALDHSDAELRKQIADGGDGMPAFKDKLKPEEIDNMIKYVRKQFQGGGKSTASDSLAPANPATKK